MIIGFSGKKESGKDTAAQYLVTNYGFTKVAFADKLKESAAACFDIVEVYWEELKNNPNAQVMIIPDTHIYEEMWEVVGEVSVREFLQNYGKAHRDMFGADFWINEMFKDMDLTKDYVVSDVRYVNEAEKIISLDGEIYSIFTDTPRTFDPHESEQNLPESLFSGRIINSGPVEKLYALLDFVMQRKRVSPVGK